MDPLDTGDAGALGSVFDTITGTVNSVRTFGQTVGEATTFEMGTAMIWAVICFMFLALISRLVIAMGKPWNDAAAERWRHTIRSVPPHVRPQDPREARIQELEERLAAALAQLAALTASQDALTEADNVDRQTTVVG